MTYLTRSIAPVSGTRSAVPTGTLATVYAVGLTAIAVLWPRYFFLPMPGGVSANPFTLGGLFTFVVASALLAMEPQVRSEWTRRFLGSFTFWIFLTFIVSRLASDALGIQPALSFKATSRNIVVTAPYFFGLSVLLTIPQARRAALTTLVVSLIFAALLAPIELITGKSIASLLHISQLSSGDQLVLQMIGGPKLRGGALRAQSIFTHPIILGQVMGASLPLMMHEAFHARGARKVLGIAGFALAALAVILSGTRSAILVAGVSLAAYWALNLPKGQIRLFAASAAVFIIPLMLGDTLTGLIAGRNSAEASSSLARLSQLQAGLANFYQRPLLGYGENMSLLTGGIMSSSGLRVIDNGYLSSLLDFGLIGTGLWIAFIAAVIMRGMRHTVEAPSKSERSIAAALTCLVIGIAVGALVQSIIDLQTLSCISAAMLVIVPLNKVSVKEDKNRKAVR